MTPVNRTDSEPCQRFPMRLKLESRDLVRTRKFFDQSRRSISFSPFQEYKEDTKYSGSDLLSESGALPEVMVLRPEHHSQVCTTHIDSSTYRLLEGFGTLMFAVSYTSYRDKHVEACNCAGRSIVSHISQCHETSSVKYRLSVILLSQLVSWCLASEFIRTIGPIVC